MLASNTALKRLKPCFEKCEERTMMSLVFVLNGNSFNAAGPSSLTANAASVLRRAGDHVVQISYPHISNPAALDAMARSIARRTHGQAIGLVGFSAGGALALRLAATPGLDVRAALDYYGVPDVRAYLRRHAIDQVYGPVAGFTPFRAALVTRLSGPIATSARVIAAYGSRDPLVQATSSTAELLADDPAAHVYGYVGGHGVSIGGSRPALEDFLEHLG